MTTGATIHTTEGLNMTVTRRIKPPTMTVETSSLKDDSSINVRIEAVADQKDKVSAASS